MGTSTKADIVPFVIHCTWYADSWRSLGEVVTDMIPDEDLINEGKTVSSRGWKTVDLDDIGKRKRIYAANRVVSDDGEHTVWLHNESPYSMVDNWSVAIVAEDRASIDAFVETFRDTFNDPEHVVVEEVDTIMMTY